MRPIEFTAEVRQIRSMSDHSVNLILNIPEYHIKQVQEMMTMLGDMVAVAMVSVDSEEQASNKRSKSR